MRLRRKRWGGKRKTSRVMGARGKCPQEDEAHQFTKHMAAQLSLSSGRA